MTFNTEKFKRDLKKITKEDVANTCKLVGRWVLFTFAALILIVTFKTMLLTIKGIPSLASWVFTNIKIVVADTSNTTTKTLWIFALMWFALQVLNAFVKIFEVCYNCMIKEFRK